MAKAISAFLFSHGFRFIYIQFVFSSYGNHIVIVFYSPFPVLGKVNRFLLSR